MIYIRRINLCKVIFLEMFLSNWYVLGNIFCLFSKKRLSLLPQIVCRWINSYDIMTLPVF